MSKHLNSPDTFPELRLEELQEYAKRWVGEHPDIDFERISLYRSGRGKTELQRLLSDRLPYFPNYIKYVLVFEISNNVDLSKADTCPIVGGIVVAPVNFGELEPKQLNSERYEDKCVRSLRKILCPDEFVNSPADLYKHSLFDLKFPATVYRYPPEEGFYREWRPFLKSPNRELDGLVDKETYWVLYSLDSLIDSQEHLDNEYENFIRYLKLSYENDNEIRVQVPGKTRRNYTCQHLGFKNNNTMEWKALVKILEDPGHKFHLGPAGSKSSNERKVYDSRRSILREINKKIVEFLRKEYDLPIPKEYKFFEKCPEEGSGTFKFKFGDYTDNLFPQTLEAKFNALTDQEIKDAVKNLSKKYKKTPDEKCTDEFVAAAKVAMQKRVLTDVQIKRMLEPIKPPEEHIYDKYENVEDIEPGH